MPVSIPFRILLIALILPACGIAEGPESTFSPPISGELVDLTRSDPLVGFRFNQSSGTTEPGSDRLKVTFGAGPGYPNVFFPVPKGGWNLSAFAGVEIQATNTSSQRVRVFLRVDNPRGGSAFPGDPWNTQSVLINPGETQPLRLVFGQNNGAPAFPLNPARVTAIQVFVAHPKQEITLVLSDLKAWGSPDVHATQAALTRPEDRAVPVTPPTWLGERPPVPGDWVETLNENFDGNQLDKRIWSTGFPWDGLQPGQLQRYAPENVVVNEGVAEFIVEKRGGHHNDDPARPFRDYTSGLIQTYDKWTQLYGYVEARIKLPTTRGLWPAFWTMPDRGAASGLDLWKRRSTSNGGMENDILEHLTEWGPGRNNVAVHWDDYGPNHQAWGTSHVYFGPTPDGWHVFGMLWEPGRLTWFIDGKKVVEWENERVGSVPSYLKLNVQMGGWATKDVDDAALPDRMRVDYVRAWQLRERLGL